MYSNEDFFSKRGVWNKTNFWLDYWCDAKPLMDIYPKLFNLCLHKEISIQEMKSLCNDHLTDMESMWRRELRSWENEEEDKLFNIILNFSPSNCEDAILWKVNSKGYTIKEGYSQLSRYTQQGPNSWNQIWKCKVPLQLNFFFGNLNSTCCLLKCSLCIGECLLALYVHGVV